MSLNIKRIQLTENGVPQDVDILTSAECVTFEDGDTLQAKLDNGDLASSDVLGDVDSLDGSVVDSLNELNESAKETSELVSELANRPSVTSALRKEVCDETWEDMGTLPYDFANSCAVVLDDEIHILGSSESSYYKYHYKYNGSTWESVSTLPYSFCQGSAVVYDNEIHILSGNKSTASHYKFNGLSWESVSTLPYNFSYACGLVFNNEIHLLGGQNTSGTNIKIYCIWNGSSWSEINNLPYHFLDGSAVVHQGQVHIMGSRYYNNSYLYAQYHYKHNGVNWESVSTLPYQFYQGGAVVYQDEIHILGGSSSYNTSHYKYNGNSWEKLLTNPYRFTKGGLVMHRDKIHILGSGYSADVFRCHYSLKPQGTYLNGYSKADTELYLPISTTPITSNLTATEDGYTVTEDGYVEILLNE